MKKTLLTAALALSAHHLAQAEIVEIRWAANGQFEHRMNVAPGKFAEICGPLQKNQSVKWAFDADRALNFNIHYHVGKDVHYPAQHSQVSKLAGLLPVDMAQDYCWMWVNKSGSPASLQLRLTRS